MFGRRRRRPEPPVGSTFQPPVPVPAGDALRPWIVARIAERGFSLGPPLSEDEVEAFAVIHGVELPEPYRWFLTHVGNGGDGPPGYGLAPLNDARNERPEHNPNIARPYPLTEPWIGEDEPDSDDDAVDAAYSNGRVWLGTDGCGGQWVLIVAGPCKGEVWFVSGEGAAPTEPRRDFLGWYAEWLAKR
jgi:hypothetical protein